MIAYVQGKLAEASPTGVVVDCGGVGYAVQIPVSSYDKLPTVGGEVKLLTYHHVNGQDGTQLAQGQIQLYDFVNPAGLESIGRNLFRVTPSSGDPVSATPGTNGLGTLAQGFLEMSNVNVVEEMVAMIVAQRAYESNSKTIQTADTLLQLANNVKR